jgi:hypothetical protein
MRPPEASVPPQTEEPPPPFTLFVHSFGPNRYLAQRLIDQVQAWDEANRPGVAGLRIRAYPVGDGFTAARNEQVVTKQWHQFVIDYPDN